MIASLSGKVADIDQDSMTIDIHGVGYLVFCSTRTLSVADIGQDIKLIIDTIIREDQFSLYGFTQLEEKEWFKLLYSVQGVGPRMALSILDRLAPEEIKNAIVAQDKTKFRGISGVGPKMTSRIINELKNAKQLQYQSVDDKIVFSNTNSAVEEAVQALVNFGFNRNNARRAVEEILSVEPSATIDRIIKKGLQKLSSA